jgi:uncharacterized membrane protein YfhO
VFFDAEHIYAGIALVMTLRIGAVGWALSVYLTSKREDWAAIFFAAGYALSSYFVAYGSNLMWLDGIMILPFMVLGIEKLIDEGKWRLYLFTIAYGVITCFYIGYMLCVFSVLYFVGYFIISSSDRRNIKTSFVYALSSIAGGAISAVVSLPTVYAMQDGKASFSLASIMNWSVTDDLLRITANSFLGTIEDLQLVSGAPLIYCGVIIFMLGFCYFMDGKILLKKKLFYGFLMAFLIFSMRHLASCYIWQGFNLPNGAPYRFSFLYIFLMLSIAYETYGNISEMKGLRRFAIPAISAVILLALLMSMRGIFAVLNHGHIWRVNVALVMIYASVLIFADRIWLRNIALISLVGFELVIGAVNHYSNSEFYIDNTTVAEFTSYYNAINELADEVREDDGLYRTVLTGDAYRMPTDNFLFNLYGLDSYTSLEQNMVLDQALRFGYYRHIVFGVHYREGSTLAAETLLGVKYIITSEDEVSGYTKLDSNDTFSLYENDNSMPLAMLADEGILSVEIDPFDSFEYQNRVLESLADIDTPVFSRADMEVADDGIFNCTKQPDGTYLVTDTGAAGLVTLRVAIDEPGAYYMETNTSDATDVVVTINGEELEFGESVIKRLGNLTSDDELLIRCTIEGDAEYNVGRNLDNILVYREDSDALAAYADAVAEQNAQVSHDTDDHITVNITNDSAENRYLFFTISDDAGWSATVDGEKTEINRALSNFMAVELTPGEHTVELHYVSKGFGAGLVITCLALLAVLAAGYISKKHVANKIVL